MDQSTEFGMAVRRYGTGPREVVYLHGLGEAAGIFEALHEHLSLDGAEFTHTVPDLPGYGRSEWPDEPYGLAGLADQLAIWLSGFPRPPLLVGHSMGGALAVLIAEKAPAVVKAIVNIEGNVSLDDCTFSGQIAHWPEATYGVLEHADIASRIYAQGRDGGPERFYYAAFRFADPKSTHRHALDLVALSATEDMAARMANLAIPCVFICGVPRGISARSLHLLDAAHVRTVRVDPAGHWVYVDQPGACAAVVAELA